MGKGNARQVSAEEKVKAFMSRFKKNVGDWGEGQACDFLRRQGFTIAERNYFTPNGEIDIIARKGGDYYFIEVKTRSKGPWATDGAITPAKKRRFLKAIKVYCYQRRLPEMGIIPAGLLVIYDRETNDVNFRLAVFTD